MTEVKSQKITRELVDQAYSYQEYKKLINELLANDKTTGDNHSETMLHYTKMNVHRMNRQDEQTGLNENLVGKLKQVDREWIWLVLTEAWSGDAAQSAPIFNKMAEVSDKIRLRFILRDENLDIMDQFLHNGISRSIPKLICLDAKTLEVIGDWGPRSQEAQTFYDNMKSYSDANNRKVTEQLHKWYADDKGREIQKEFYKLIDEWLNK